MVMRHQVLDCNVLEGEPSMVESSTHATSMQPLQHIFEELIDLVGEDKVLIKEACEGLKWTLGHVHLVKAHKKMDNEANVGFITMEDNFGNTLKRAQPFCERKYGKKLQEPIVQPFMKPKKLHKVSMQSKLDAKAKKLTTNVESS
ncbi:hypothetical protein GOP47_0015962 [Adiantum capillus-veneris]|uniref:Uncharacterized protein n=1 Tax=Adiantum capillus-veneris TaxID=13818 RepID=A0A9D4ULJ6_ADICA|nr:hypothetical protein GOP47_0015962 [Adiantum capillus-veneris]